MCRSIVNVVGLGFKSTANGQDIDIDSAFICTEACLSGSLRELVQNQTQQMDQARPVCCTHSCRHACMQAHTLALVHAQ